TDIFIKEGNGLKELSKNGSIRIPQVHLSEYEFLLTEFIEPGIRNNDFFSNFGRQFALLHQYQSDKFGFFEDNYIGANVQINKTNTSTESDWTAFYFENRLLYQMHLADKNGYADTRLKRAFSVIENNIETILQGSEEPPALLHGDLWSGNFMCGYNSEAVLIDPAVYYGHREADLAMTKLFGGFSYDFYASYIETYPLKKEYEYRENIYLLYHVLNHLNLFGQGYYEQAVSLMEKYK
ncbi:fructosamine kinase family protein, partial [Bacteroidota bacterium]